MFLKLDLQLLRCIGSPTRRGQAMLKINFLHSFNCSPPRKSLVKGERFFRFEGEPELWIIRRLVPYMQSDRSPRRAVGQISYNTVFLIGKFRKGLCACGPRAGANFRSRCDGRQRKLVVLTRSKRCATSKLPRRLTTAFTNAIYRMFSDQILAVLFYVKKYDEIIEWVRSFMLSGGGGKFKQWIVRSYS